MSHSEFLLSVISYYSPINLILVKGEAKVQRIDLNS